MFTTSDIVTVWQKATIVNGYDPARVRKDICGAWIEFLEYGNRQSQYGWEIDHIDPDGGDYFTNLQPLHWRNNAAKGDGDLVCAVTAR